MGGHRLAPLHELLFCQPLVLLKVDHAKKYEEYEDDRDERPKNSRSEGGKALQAPKPSHNAYSARPQASLPTNPFPLKETGISANSKPFNQFGGILSLSRGIFREDPRPLMQQHGFLALGREHL